jgi:hypothetical protein
MILVWALRQMQTSIVQNRNIALMLVWLIMQRANNVAQFKYTGFDFGQGTLRPS